MTIQARARLREAVSQNISRRALAPGFRLGHRFRPDATVPWLMKNQLILDSRYCLARTRDGLFSNPLNFFFPSSDFVVGTAESFGI